MKEKSKCFELEQEIDKLERSIDRAQMEINEKKNLLDEKKKELGRLMIGVDEDSITVGSKLVFEDEDGVKFEMIVVADCKRYNAVLTTDNRNIYEYMHKYYLFEYRCIYISTLIRSIESELDLTLVNVIIEN